MFYLWKVLGHLWNDYIKEVRDEYEKNINFSQKYIVKDLDDTSVECKTLDKFDYINTVVEE